MRRRFHLFFWSLLVAASTGFGQSSNCVPPVDALVSWWKLEGNGANEIGTNAGVLLGAPTFDYARVGLGMNFDGTNDQVDVAAAPELDLGAGDGMTVEFWIQPRDLSGLRPIIEWNNRENSGRVGTIIWHSLDAPGSVYVYLPFLGDNNFREVVSPAGTLQVGVLQHIAFTYDRLSGAASLYRDGAEVYATNLASFHPDTTGDFFLGVRAAGPNAGARFAGHLDEVSLYSRALTAGEIEAIHAAAGAGKCFSARPPSIINQPGSVTVFEGETAQFDIIASGVEAFQWFFNEAELPGETNASLILTNVQLSQAGSYVAKISGSGETNFSQVASLTINDVPDCAPVGSGLVGWWKLEGNAADEVNPSLGTIAGSPRFTQAKVGLGMIFDGVDDQVNIPASPALDVGKGDGLSLEFWIQPSTFSGLRPVIEWNTGSMEAGENVYLWHSLATPGDVYVYLPFAGGYSEFVAPEGTLQGGVLQHVAFTYDRVSGRGHLYRNGVLVHEAELGSFHPFTDGDFYLGVRAAGPAAGAHFAGVLDEVSVYARALSGAEAATIFHVGALGKCRMPLAPQILAQPQSLTVFEGHPAALNVAATGVESYQWFFNGQILSGQTNATLALTDVQVNQGGDYSVEIRGGGQLLTSDVAVLTVIDVPDCAPTGESLVAWWKFEGNALDHVNANFGTLVGNPQFVTGSVTQALAFDGVDDQVNVPASPSLDVGAREGMTIELWIQPATLTGLHPLVEWNNWPFPEELGAFMWHSLGAPGDIYVYLPFSGGFREFVAPGGTLQSGVWQHIAFTYDRTSGEAHLYRNGVQVRVATLGSFRPATTGNLYIGARPAGPSAGAHFNGALDEVSIYGRAITALEAETIFRVGARGKCVAPQPPEILTQPENLTILEGQTARLSIAAARVENYQWFFNGQELADQTNATLVLRRTQLNQAGIYFVTLRSAGQTVTSREVELTVIDVADCAPSGLGLVAWWKLEGNAHDELRINSGTLNGLPEFVAAAVNQGLNFDGHDDQINVPASRLLNVGTGDGMTIELWIQPETLLGLRPIVEWNNWPVSESLGTLMWHSLDRPGNVYVFLPFSGGFQEFISPEGTLEAGVLQHLAFTYDRLSGEARLYRNGVQVHADNLGSFHPMTTGNFFMGVRSSGPAAGARFDGVMDEVSIYSRAISAAEAAEIYRVGAGGKCTALQIVGSPRDLSVFTGSEASFEVAVIGAESYQWLFNGQPLAGETNATLILPGIGMSQAGNYSARVTAGSEFLVSDSAVLTVVELPACAPAGLGVAGWWKLESNAFDEVSMTLGNVVGSPEFGPATVGSGLIFDGIDDHIQISGSPTLNVGSGDGFSVELWIQPSMMFGERPIFEWNNFETSQQLGVYMWHSLQNPGDVYLYLPYTNGYREFIAPGGTLQFDVMQHLAFTYDRPSGQARLYRNGVLAHESNLGSFHADTTGDLYLGVRPAGPAAGTRFLGVLDEVSVYARALGAMEVDTLFHVGPRGKCPLFELEPVILVQPEDTFATNGSTATFSVVADGAAPLSYQWRYKGDPIDGATAPTLVLANVDPAQAGRYSVVISNAFGEITSDNARLTVYFDLATIDNLFEIVTNSTLTVLRKRLMVDDLEALREFVVLEKYNKAFKELKAFREKVFVLIDDNYPGLQDELDDASKVVRRQLQDFRSSPKLKMKRNAEAIELVTIEFDGDLGATYDVEVSDDLVGWQVIGQATELSEGRYEFVVPPEARPFQFYRAVAE